MDFRKQVLPGLLIVLLAALFPAPADPQFIQQGPKLTGTGGFGYSVALSADGNLALVGAPEDSGGTGAAWVFVRGNGVWSQEAKLVGTGTVGKAGQGESVALSGDGNTAIVGGPADNGSAGAAWVFVRNAGVWSQQGPKLVGTGAIQSARQGFSVALSADGKTALVGGPDDGPYLTGATWVFTSAGGTWRQQGLKLVGKLAEGYAPMGTWQGRSVSLSADGNTALVVGSEYLSPSNYQGKGWVFIRRSGLWRQQALLPAAPRSGLWAHGALSADGNTAVLSAGRDDDSGGTAVVYKQGNGVWRQQASGLSPGFDDDYGSVVLSADGNTAVVGGYFTTAAGLFTRTGGVWAAQSSELTAAGAGVHCCISFPVNVAISGDGNTILLSWWLYNSGEGAVWVFANPSANPGPSPGWTRVPVPVGVPNGVSRDGLDRNLEAVAYGTFGIPLWVLGSNPSMFVIGARAGNIMTYDGGPPVKRAMSVTGISGIAFGVNEPACILVADSGYICRSTDRLFWHSQQVSPSNNFGGVAYSDYGYLVAVQAGSANSPGGRIFHSSDLGQTWQESLNMGQPWTSHDLTGVAFGNGTWVVTAQGSQILYSTDNGLTWKVSDLSQTQWIDEANKWQDACPLTDLVAVAFGHGQFVAAGANGAVFTSTDSGKTWTWTFVDPAGSSRPLHGIAFGSGSNQEYFVAVGKDGVTLIGTVDLLTGAIAWTRASFPTTYLRGVTFGMGRFVAVGYGATIAQSKPLPW